MTYADLIAAGPAPSFYARLAEPAGATAFADSAAGLTSSSASGVTAGTPTPTGAGATLSGSGSSIRWASHAAISPTGSAGAFECVFRPAALGGFQEIVCKPVSDGSWSGPFAQYRFSLNGASLAGQFAVGGSLVGPTASTSLSNGVTYHALCAYDGAAVRLYLDGSLAGSSPATGALSTYTSSLWVGNGPATEPFNGVVSDVAVYPAALDANHAVARYLALRGRLGVGYRARPPRLARPADGRVRWLGDLAGGIGRDLSGTAADAANAGATPETGPLGRCLAFGAASLTAPDRPGLQLPRWTAAALVRADSFAGYGMVLCKGSNGARNYSILVEQGTGRPLAQYTGGGFRTATGADPLAAGRWHHLAATFDGATLAVYLDGRPAGATATTATPDQSSVGPLTLGRTSDGFAPLAGAIDAPVVLAGALSPAGVAALAADPYRYARPAPRAWLAPPSAPAAAAAWPGSLLCHP